MKLIIKNPFAQTVALLLGLAFAISQPVTANSVDNPVLHPSIPLLDEEGNHVLDSGKAYSSKMTCGTGGCHDYESITHAFHIEQGRDEASDDFGVLRGLPQLVSPGYFGGYNCMGGSNPDTLAKKSNESADDFADLGSPDMVKRCITCHAGGGWMEKDRNGNRYDEVDITTVPMLDGDYYSRNTNAGSDSHDGMDHSDHDMGGIAAWDWQKSGVVENDCLMCHVSFNSLNNFDPLLGDETAPLDQFRTLRNKVLAGQNYYRYVNTALLEFFSLEHGEGEQADVSLVSFEKEEASAGDHGGHGSHGGASYALVTADDHEPVLNWNADAFDENGKVAIPMLRFPENDNCMNCHRTSNSRRGFYGFGEGAEATFAAADGTLEEDYQDDVHKGKTWVEPNGEERNIENCNACHSRNYFNPSFANVDLDANHNFLKGNSDMDVRNDLDYEPNAKSCEYCHNDAPNPAIPSGQDSMLSAHLELWKANGDMAGYPQSTLTRITETHLDIVSCQTCHITDKKSRGRPLAPMYRYREAENGNLTIVPYNPRMRYYWKDNNSGRVMTKTERNSVFVLREDEEGQKYGAIIDPTSLAVLGTVSARMSHGSWRFGEPEDYETFMSLKRAFDKVLRTKGVDNPDAVMVWTESNQYLMSHNTRPAVASVQCAECHSRKQDGSFSALVSTDGLFGEANVKTVTTLPDRRLVDEGVVILDMPYMKIDDDGVVTENVADILYASKVDPSMTILKAATAKAAMGEVERMGVAEGLAKVGFSEEEQNALAELYEGGDIYLFTPAYGDDEIAGVALMPAANQVTELMFPSYKMEVAIADDSVTQKATRYGGLDSAVYSIEAKDKSGSEVDHFSGTRVLIKLPYSGASSDSSVIKVIFSQDGESWNQVDVDDIAMIQPHSEERNGYVAFWTDHFSYYAVADTSRSASTTATPEAGSAEAADDGEGGGGAAWWITLVALIGLALRVNRRRTIS